MSAMQQSFFFPFFLLPFYNHSVKSWFCFHCVNLFGWQFHCTTLRPCNYFGMSQTMHGAICFGKRAHFQALRSSLHFTGSKVIISMQTPSAKKWAPFCNLHLQPFTCSFWRAGEILQACMYKAARNKISVLYWENKS